MAIIFIALVQSFLLVSIYYHVGQSHLSLNLKKDAEVVIQWMGVCFLSTSDSWIICAFAMILQIPLEFPVYKREMGSRMYTSSAYFFASYLANVLVYIFYPISCALLCFWFYDFRASNFTDFLVWVSIMGCMGMSGLSFGQVIGSFVESDYAALSWLL